MVLVAAMTPAWAADTAGGSTARDAGASIPAVSQSESFPVRFGDETLFEVSEPSGALTAEARAGSAAAAVAQAAQNPEPSTVRLERQAEHTTVYAGEHEIFVVTAADARAAGRTLEAHAELVAAQVRDALERERTRSQIARTVFSLSLTVFLALIAIYLLRKLRELGRRLRERLHSNPELIPALRLRSLEVLSPAALRSFALIGVAVGRWVGALGVVYTYLVVVFSLFDATRGLTERLTGFVVAPISGLAGRIAASIPVLIVAAIAGLAVFLLVRFVGLFLAEIARGATRLSWMPRDLAAPTSILLRIAIVVAAVVFGAPLVTGHPESTLSRTGVLALVALGLASTPLLANAIAGAIAIFYRRLRLEDRVVIGGRRGRVRELGFLAVRLEDDAGDTIFVPHLLTLFQPTHVLSSRSRASVDVWIKAKKHAAARQELLAAAQACGTSPNVALESVDGDLQRYRVTVAMPLGEHSELLATIAERMAAADLEIERAARSSD